MKTLRTYIIGFGLSLLITLVAFGVVEWHLLTDHVFPTHEVLFPLLIALAVLQMAVQLLFFLHLADEAKPRWQLIMAALAIIVVAILVGGTLWIMHNLDHMQAMPDMSDIYEGGIISPQTQND